MTTFEGNIPAHAGKTRFRLGLLSLMREHPRSRGENLETMSEISADVGTSPLTRGKRPYGLE